MERKLTCVVCPLGCDLTVQLEDGKVVAVSGNTCPRGKVYAETECVNPMRTVCSTMRCDDGSMVAVKTDRPIPKAQMFACMRRINEAVATLPVKVGDVLLTDVCGSNVVATQNKQ